MAALLQAGAQTAFDARATVTDDDQACLTCHADTKSYAHTAHRLTSTKASEAVLAPVFKAAGDKLVVTSAPLPSLLFAMEMHDGRFWETAITGWGDDVVRSSEPVDVVVGSGKRGQTFLYWSGERLFELPVSYWRDGHRWINSPGYVDATADFKRPVQPGCLECHATSIVPLTSDLTTNSYDRNSLVTGIRCVTCHGPGEAHVAAEKAAVARGAKAAESAILNPAHFTRERQIDLCALCHSGIQRTELKPAFSYKPGDPLSSYFAPMPGAAQERPDVHGNQVGLLQRSRCFAGSQMTCSTCHNVHTVGQPAAAYAPKCLQCHTLQSCGEYRKAGASIAGKCIDCHMPLQHTNAIVSTTAGERVQASMRTHWIQVYSGTTSARH